jgi:HSP20 family protein
MITNLLPTVWRRSGVPVRGTGDDTFFTLHRGINEMFNDFFRDFDLSPIEGGVGLSEFTPSLDVRESEKNVVVKAELPGMEEKDIEVSVSDNGLTIKGEKKADKEEKGAGYWRREVSYGSFCLAIPLPEGLNMDKVDAHFKNGVLTITLDRLEEAKVKGKKIDIKTE